MLDQYDSTLLLPDDHGVDLVLLYGLSAFWKPDLRLRRPYRMVPPYIGGVTPAEALPMPARLRDHLLITFVAYDEHCLRVGAELLRTLRDPQVGVVSISRDPAAARRLLDGSGLVPDRVLTLPLQLDPHVFGFLQVSSAALLSNGFIQIMDSLALGCPVITLSRGAGVGMGSLNLVSRFAPYVSLDESLAKQYRRLTEWLRRSPFPPRLAEDLRRERQGAQLSADLVEELVDLGPVRRPGWLPLQRIRASMGRRAGR